jgi:hypothetical protein
MLKERCLRECWKNRTLRDHDVERETFTGIIYAERETLTVNYNTLRTTIQRNADSSNNNNIHSSSYTQQQQYTIINNYYI